MTAEEKKKYAGAEVAELSTKIRYQQAEMEATKKKRAQSKTI